LSHTEEKNGVDIRLYLDLIGYQPSIRMQNGGVEHVLKARRALEAPRHRLDHQSKPKEVTEFYTNAANAWKSFKHALF
jgi:hypothetical protein